MLYRELGDEEPEPDALDRVRAGSRQRSLPALSEPSEDRSVKLAARCEGFSLEAGRHLHENDRRGLEALLQYCLRPPVAQQRLTWASEDGSELVWGPGGLAYRRAMDRWNARYCTWRALPLTLPSPVGGGFGLNPIPRSLMGG
jgi:hypothetical protein